MHYYISGEVAIHCGNCFIKLFGTLSPKENGFFLKGERFIRVWAVIISPHGWRHSRHSSGRFFSIFVRQVISLLCKMRCHSWIARNTRCTSHISVKYYCRLINTFYKLSTILFGRIPLRLSIYLKMFERILIIWRG